MTIAEAVGDVIDADRGRATLCGALRISRDGQAVFERAYGQASRQLGVANTTSTRFHIASMTKMFIAAAVVRMSQEGRLSLRAHPSAYVPELSRLHPDVTLHHLLCHTAGLADVYDVPDLRLQMGALAARQGRLLDYLADLPPLQPPGVGWRYSTTGFLLLAYALENAAGVPFPAVIAGLFLAPLGLADTGPDDPLVVNPGRATGHSVGSAGWRHTPNDALADIEAPREFYSTVGDLDLWATALQQGRALDDAGKALMFAPHARVAPGGDFDPSHDYGYGLFLADGYRWIGGATDGFRAAMWMLPRERINVVMLSNNERDEPHRLFAALRPILSR